MDRTAKQTALFFGFLGAAMSYASAQAAPAGGPATAPVAVHRDVGDAARADRLAVFTVALKESTRPSTDLNSENGRAPRA